MMYSLGKCSYSFIAKLFGVSRTAIQNWLEQESDLLRDPVIEDNLSEIEFDEMWHFINSKKKKCWIIKAYDRQTKRTIAWVTGNRDTASFRKLYEKVRHLKFYTDDWLLQKFYQKKHVIGKSGTVGIERDNSNTRHNLARMTRRTKIVSRSERTINKILNLWVNLREQDIFDKFQKTALTIF